MPATERYVALLRGINVGRAKRVAMADLRDLVEALGYVDVRTLLNSGNVVFTGGRKPVERIATSIEEALLARTGVASAVTVLTSRMMHDVVAGNPWPAAAEMPSRFLVGFLRDADQARRQLEPVTFRAWGDDRVAVGPQAAYCWCAGGILESEMLTAVGRALGDGVTMRNWTTVTKLAAIA